MNSRPAKISRRKFLQTTSLAAAGTAFAARAVARDSLARPALPPLARFEYGDVDLASEAHEKQLDETHRVLRELDDDALLKPVRAMSGQPAPGEDLGGWYAYVPDYKLGMKQGFAPACTFGQWVSALARMYAIRRDEATRAKAMRLNRLYAQTISGDFYDVNRFPAYCYDKIVCGLIDSHQYLHDPEAFNILNRTTDTALPHLPPHAIEHDKPWRPNKDFLWTWDESYTISENLFLAFQRGAGQRYRDLGRQYLYDDYYNPLAEGKNVLAGRHAYSHINSLSSAMQAYLTLGSEKHLRAAANAFDMLSQQSYVTGGWGPDETLRAPGSPDLYNSLTNTHASFETPCGAYAHFKLTRYLLQVTRDARYGDSMERVMYNTVLGARPLMRDGRTFYYSDYNFQGSKFYRGDQHWACCSGTLPQVAADYRINTYFHDNRDLWVNLYIPSTLRWRTGGSDVTLRQSGDYPFDETVKFEIEAPRSRRFALNLRVPVWAEGSSIAVNGRKVEMEPIPGTFAVVRREWKSGDQVELNLPMKMRLEAIDAQHPETVGLVRGPLALLAVTDHAPNFSRGELLGAKRTAQRRWRTETSEGAVDFLPFTEIEDQRYSTYLRVS